MSLTMMISSRQRSRVRSLKSSATCSSSFSAMMWCAIMLQRLTNCRTRTGFLPSGWGTEKSDHSLNIFSRRWGSSVWPRSSRSSCRPSTVSSLSPNTGMSGSERSSPGSAPRRVLTSCACRLKKSAKPWMWSSARSSRLRSRTMFRNCSSEMSLPSLPPCAPTMFCSSLSEGKWPMSMSVCCNRFWGSPVEKSACSIEPWWSSRGGEIGTSLPPLLSGSWSLRPRAWKRLDTARLRQATASTFCSCERWRCWRTRSASTMLTPCESSDTSVRDGA
mmetsp:Transcript_18578/g.53375  ORF Transcript_18578/g.53375 Transcript_18578/m.53375 type:complete len:275 (+) Transcript_18578:390-1214(+)